MSIGGFDLSAGVLALGVFTGLTYGLLAAGLVLVYRSSRFINFAHGAIGVFGAAVVSLGVRDFEVPYWFAFLLGVAVSAGVGALTEIGVVKPLANAPKVLPMVATLGLSSFLIFTSLAINPDGLSGLNFPEPAGMPTGSIGALRVTPTFAAQAILSPILLIGLGGFLWRSRTGLAIRAAASNAEAASTAGVPSRSMSVLSWAIAGAVAAFSVTLIIPTKGVVTPESLGPELLIRGLAAAAIARFTSFGIAVGVATLIGVVEQVLATNPEANGLIELVILAAVIIALMTSSKGLRAPLENWGQRSLPRRLPDAYRGIPVIRLITPLVAIGALVAAAFVPFVATGSQALDATVVVSLAIVALSVVIVTGLGGQLSLAQFAYAAVGAAVSIRVSAELGFVVGVAVGAVFAALVSLLLALPALRVRGLQLGVASLIFAVVTTAWLLDRSFLLGGADPAVRPSIELFGIDTASSRGYFWIALVALVIAMAFAHRLRGGGWGRALVAVRDNEEAARALSLPARSMKLQAAAVGGLIAGVGGAIYGHSLSNIGPVNFPVQSSIDAVTAAVIGGLGSIAGPVIGAAYLIGIPAFFTPSAEATSALAGAWIVLIVYQQGGIAAVVSAVMDRVYDAIARARGIDPTAARATQTPPSAEEDPATGTGPEDGEPAPAVVTSLAPHVADEIPMLVVAGVSKHYGGVSAVDDVSFEVATGETVGLIGPNGAGKTTLFEVVSGFVRPDSGTVSLHGRDITKLAPEARSRAGIARSFQSATLFPTLTLTETVMVAQERRHPSSLIEALGTRRAEHARERRARAAIERFELTRFADAPVGALPTGTRRLAELICAVELRPSVILLDEPSAGIAHTEMHRLGETLIRIREEFGVTMVIIEHDLPLLSEVCDRMIAMNAGEKIAEGTPADVREHPEVVESYVG